MKRKKKIHLCIIDAESNPDLPSYDIARDLAKKGYTITLLTTKSRPLDTLRSRNISLLQIGLSGLPRWCNKVLFFLLLPFIVASRQDDIIIEYFLGTIPVQVTPLFTKVPVIGIPQLFSGEIPDYGLRVLTFSLEQRRLQLYTHIIAYTKDIASAIKRGNPACTVGVIPFGIGGEYLSLKQVTAEYILFLGNFTFGKKGLDLLIQAYKKVSSRIKYPLFLAGHGIDESKVRALIAKLHLQKRVFVLGPTYGDKKLSVLSKALFLAYPSRHDDVPLVALEAIASGLPLVAFDIPELSWADESIALKAVPFDVADYSRLLRVMAESKKTVLMRSEAKKFAKKYSKSQMVNLYDKFIVNTLGYHKKKII